MFLSWRIANNSSVKPPLGAYAQEVGILRRPHRSQIRRHELRHGGVVVMTECVDESEMGTSPYARLALGRAGRYDGGHDRQLGGGARRAAFVFARLEGRFRHQVKLRVDVENGTDADRI